jgi:hypothetical protein
MRKPQIHFLLILLVTAFVFGACKKGEKKENQAPETLLVPKAVNLSGEQSLITRVHLNWFGTDKDGYVKGYRVSINNGDWFFTEKTDSVFLFPIPEGSRYGNAEIKVAAIDHTGLEDPTPAYVKLPLKNTNPTAAFDKVFSSKDSALAVISLYWSADDPDGTDNLKNLQIRANNGPWVSLDRKMREVHIVAGTDTTSAITAKLYDGNRTLLKETLGGIVPNGLNQFYLRAVDMAAALSTEDTLKNLYLRSRKADVLFVSGDETAFNTYKTLIGSAANAFDILNLASNNGAQQPAKWDPTFTLLLQQYQKTVFTNDDKRYNNAATGTSTLLLEAAARSFREYFNGGGKLLCIAFFKVDESISPNSQIFGAYPIDSISYSAGSVIIDNKSPALISKATGYPDLALNKITSKLVPFHPTSDATAIYTGDLSPRGGWKGPEVLGAARGVGGKTTQVFMGAYLYDFYPAERTKLEQLFDHILNTEFK